MNVSVFFFFWELTCRANALITDSNARTNEYKEMVRRSLGLARTNVAPLKAPM